MASSKVLLIFCDGTGMDGNLSELDVAGDVGKQRPTNVLRLSRAVRPLDANNQRRQIVFYQSGVGSESDFSGDLVLGSSSMRILGATVAGKIRDAYVFLAQNFEEGDEICIFGGAYTARKLAGLIYKIGLLREDMLGYFFRIWQQLNDHQNPEIPIGTRFTRIKCVGVWDTVGSIYNEINALSIQDTELEPNIDYALHALAMQENRKRFLPTLWTVWFPGAHSDVGGSYARSELADISLFWMAGEIENFVHLDLGFLRACPQQHPDAWGTSQPHNAYEETPWTSRWVLGHETRLKSGQITADSNLHQSIQFAPLKLKDPEHMITLATLQASFGQNWTPRYEDLNEFEQFCRSHWGEPPIRGAPSPPVFEDAHELFPSPTKWVPVHNDDDYQGAIKGGSESNEESPFYVVRAYHNGELYPGKSRPGLPAPIAHVSVNGAVHTTPTFEVLKGNDSHVRWIPIEGEFAPFHLTVHKAVPLRAGNEGGHTLWIAKATVDGGTHCGKVRFGSVALIPYDGEEVKAYSYWVLVYA